MSVQRYNETSRRRSWPASSPLWVLHWSLGHRTGHSKAPLELRIIRTSQLYALHRSFGSYAQVSSTRSTGASDPTHKSALRAPLELVPPPKKKKKLPKRQTLKTSLLIQTSPQCGLLLQVLSIGMVQLVVVVYVDVISAKI